MYERCTRPELMKSLSQLLRMDCSVIPVALVRLVAALKATAMLFEHPFKRHQTQLWSRNAIEAQHLVPELRQLLLGVLANVGALLGIGQHLPRRLLALVVRLSLDFPPLLESVIRLATIPSSPNPPTCEAYLATTSWYFHPNSCPSLPTVQYFLPGFKRSTRSACGTTSLFLRS